MFEVGDIVRIQPHNESMCMPKSPAINLKDSICRIKSANIVNKYISEYTYHLEIIERHVQDVSCIYGGEEDMSWRDHHLVMVEPVHTLEEIDVMSVFSEGDRYG